MQIFPFRISAKLFCNVHEYLVIAREFVEILRKVHISSENFDFRETKFLVATVYTLRGKISFWCLFGPSEDRT
jgi:hypothetical protein